VRVWFNPVVAIVSIVLYMMHDLCIIQICAVVISTNASKHPKISFLTQRTPTCFGQPCGHVQGCKIQSLGTLKLCLYNGITKLSQPVQRC
jgi:hypothetical protein